MLWYLTRDYKKWLVYDGTNLNDVLDGQEALKFNKDNPTFSVFTIPNLYGKRYTFKFPDYGLTQKQVSDPKNGWKNITFERYDKVIDLANYWYINDYTLWAHKALVETYDIYVRTSWWEDLYQLILKDTTAVEEDLKSEDPEIVKAALEKAVTLKHRSQGIDWELIMMKEAIMDYSRPDPITFKPKQSSTPKTFKVWEDYDFEFPQYNLTVNIKDNYTAALRYQMLHKALEEWNANPKYKLQQRSDLLQWWQTDVEKRMARRTVVLAPRRSWKTVVIALEILKEMLSHNYKAATRPRSVIFISKDFDAVAQVMDYINSLINEFDWMKEMFRYDATNHIFSLNTFDDKWKRQVIAQCKFYSALGKLPAVGDAADAVFFDEAMLYPKRIYDMIQPIVNNEWARLLVVSTFYSEDPDTGDRVYDWPVKLCNEWEKESSKIIDIDRHIITLRKEKERTWFIPDESAGLRYTIDDVEVIVNKDLVKNDLADDYDRYMRELYCRSSELKTVLNYKPYVLPVRYESEPYPHYVMGLGEESKDFNPKFKRIVTAYDPAQTWDISAFLACGYDEKRNKVVVLKEWWLNFKDKSSFIPQADLIKKALDELSIHNCPILKTMDSTHQAVVDVMRGQRIFFQYLYFWVGGDNVRKWARPSETRVPKHLMVEAAQTMFDNGMIEIWDQNCKMLIDQLGNFVEFKNEYTNRSKFKWASGHDDFVDCLLMCLWTFWEHLGLSHNKFQIDTVAEYKMNNQEEMDPLHLRSAPPQPRYEALDNAFWY